MNLKLQNHIPDRFSSEANLKDTEKFMSELLVAKKNIQKAIQERENKRKSFEAELDISVS